MQAVIKKWGNSAALRLPASILEESSLALDATVEISVVEGRIVIEPIEPQQDDLAALLAGITDENLHESVDFGEVVGNEAW
ncbi:AbrB/MazE/SpoVT family DNA-binding domain-containing protein [Paracandidimonas soli]|uniref:AbrB/MazE/SpoVT family DNA-binding domain-containing protein n=1 Tax=Paracandidimonas soli TaxID=1917182 RepID=UPI003341392E